MVLDNSRPLAAGETTTTVDADRGTPTCVSIGSDDWTELRASASGTVDVDVSSLQRAEVSTIQIIRSVSGTWRSQVLTPPIGALPSAPPWYTKATSWLLLVLLLPVVASVVMWLRSRRKPFAG